MNAALKRTLTDFSLVAASIAAALLLLPIAIAFAGYPPFAVLREGLTGALGTPGNLLISLRNATPLILTGLAAGVAFRSGVFNIGAEGQSNLGAVSAVIIATRLLPNLPSQWLGIPAALLAAAAGGAAWAFIAALLDRYRGVPIVLSTILLNFVALQFIGILLEGPLKAPGSQIVQSEVLKAPFHLPLLASALEGSLHAGILVALALAALAWIVQSLTTFGFEIKVTGLNPTAARFAGMPVANRQFAVMLASGAFAGLAGAMQVMGLEGHSLNDTPVSYGYAGIAVALLGRLHPLGIIAAALFFGALDAGAKYIEGSPYPLPAEFADILKAAIVLLVLVGTSTLNRPTRA